MNLQYGVEQVDICNQKITGEFGAQATGVGPKIQTNGVKPLFQLVKVESTTGLFISNNICSLIQLIFSCHKPG